MSLEDDIDALAQIDLLSDFDRDQLRLIAFGSHKLSFSSGYELFREGDKSDGGYLVLSGSIDIHVNESGFSKHVGEFGPGSMIGEMSLVAQGNRNFTASVVENCQLFKITQSTMHRVLSEYPDLAARLHQRISRQFLEFTQHLPGIQEKLMRHDQGG